MKDNVEKYFKGKKLYVMFMNDDFVEETYCRDEDEMMCYVIEVLRNRGISDRKIARIILEKFPEAAKTIKSLYEEWKEQVLPTLDRDSVKYYNPKEDAEIDTSPDLTDDWETILQEAKKEWEDDQW